MPTMSFPRTMTRGVFAGRHFETMAEYQRALNEVRRVERASGARRTPIVSGDDYKFRLVVTAGSLEFTITGDPRKGDDIDRLLSALASFGSGA